MENYKITAIPIILILIGFAFFNVNEIKELEIGSKAPMLDYEMKSIDGKMVTINDSKGENGTLLIFTSNTCPYVHAWEARYLEVSKLAKENKLGVIFVNPNEATRDKGESLEDMKARAIEKNYNFIYTLDKDHKLADAYGATRTPHVYLMDKSDNLVFVGAIDDNSRSADEVKNHYLRDAIKELSAGKPITAKHSRAIGCTIKRN